MTFEEMLGELSPSAQRATARFVAALHMMEALSLPQQGDGITSASPDPRRIPGNLDAAHVLSVAVKRSKEAEQVYRKAKRELSQHHRHIVNLAYRTGREADRVTRRVAGDFPPRVGECTHSENGVICSLPVHANNLCSKHYHQVRRRRTRRKR